MKRLLILAAACLAPWSANSQGYAARFALELPQSAPYYGIAVPDAVFAASQRGDLGDVRVLNGAGELVPYSLDTPNAPATAAPATVQAVRWFALPPAAGNTADNAGNNARSNAGNGGALNVTIAPDGSLRAAAHAAEPARRGGDVVDLSAVTGAIQALSIHLQNGSYQGRVNVAASDDLRSWTTVTQVSLLKVGSGANTLTQERVDLDGLHARYLRLRWPDGAPDIAGIEAESAPAGAVAPQDRQWRGGIVARAGQTAGEYLFDSGGAYPVDRVQFELPQSNTVARATLYSRANEQSSWRNVADGQLFRLQHGGVAAGGTTPDEQRNPPFAVDPDTDRHWRLTVDTRTGGLGAGMPAVAIGWRPATLTFVARGSAPFTLVVGNAQVASAAVNRDEILVGAPASVAIARVGQPMPPLAVAVAVAAPAAAPDPDAGRRYVLWGALLAAVAALGFMAWRLMRTAPPGP